MTVSPTWGFSVSLTWYRHLTFILTAISIAAAIVGATAAGLRTRRESVDIAAALMGLVVSGAVGIVALVVLVGTGRLDGFGTIHLVYLCAVITLPLIGLAFAVLVIVRKASRVLLAVALVLVVPAPVGFYATHIEPYRLRVSTVRVAIDPARTGDDPVRIAVLADLQTNNVGPHEHSAVDRVLQAKPDLILIPGDLFQGTADEFDSGLAKLRSVLARLKAPHGVYFVRGDVDGGDRADRAFAGTEAIILDDETTDVVVGDRTLRLGGTELDYLTQNAEAVRYKLDAQSEDGAIRILMSHRPDTVLHLPERSRVDLTVAGHTHGGQVVVPFVGPLITASRVPRAVARGGLHVVNGNAIYVSPGVGLERSQAPQVRFLSPPTVGILDLAEDE